MTGSPLVTTEWLASRLGDPTLLVFDCSFYLPAEGRDARAEYAAAHLPGARFFDIEEVADPESELPHMAPGAARFARLAGALGIRPGSEVVFYDQKGLFSAARGWWLMGLFGHERAYVLDGGLPKWRREGRPAEAGPPPPAVPAPPYPAALRTARLRGLGDVRHNLETGAEIVLDARAAGRFAGTAPEPRPGLRGGHIPGSRNLPYTELLAPDGTMLPPDALRVRLAAAGADGTRPVVASCGTGVTAAVLVLALAVSGLPAGAVYDGSWTEWASHPDTPVETCHA